jgi:hypothetical protein
MRLISNRAGKAQRFTTGLVATPARHVPATSWQAKINRLPSAAAYRRAFSGRREADCKTGNSRLYRRHS